MSFRQKDFSKIRRMESSNAILQIILLALVFTGVNYLVARYYKRIDLTQENEHSLSLETQAYLRKIDPGQPVKIIVLSSLMPKACLLYTSPSPRD